MRDLPEDRNVVKQDTDRPDLVLDDTSVFSSSGSHHHRQRHQRKEDALFVHLKREQEESHGRGEHRHRDDLKEALIFTRGLARGMGIAVALGNRPRFGLGRSDVE